MVDFAVVINFDKSQYLLMIQNAKVSMGSIEYEKPQMYERIGKWMLPVNCCDEPSWSCLYCPLTNPNALSMGCEIAHALRTLLVKTAKNNWRNNSLCQPRHFDCFNMRQTILIIFFIAMKQGLVASNSVVWLSDYCNLPIPEVTLGSHSSGSLTIPMYKIAGSIV